MPTQQFPTLHRMGEASLLVAFADHLSMPVNAAVLSFRASVDAANWVGVAETATSLKSVFLRFDPDVVDHSKLEDQVQALLESRDWLREGLPHNRRLWRIPAVFGGDHGPQLEETAAMVGLSEAAAIAAIAQTRLRVLTIGFAPGLPYLGQLPEKFDIPRKTELNPLVPKGGLGLAIRQMVMFPVDTQTGWRWIGQAAFDGFRQDSDTPFALNAGDEILYRPVSVMEYEDAVAGLETGQAAMAEALP
jgi:KipI family sensor histidine kinase inhibitor